MRSAFVSGVRSARSSPRPAGCFGRNRVVEGRPARALRALKLVLLGALLAAGTWILAVQQPPV